MILNENELRREVRITKKLLAHFDREIEKILNDERLTEVCFSKNLTAGTLRLELLELSNERRQLISQLLGRSAMYKVIEETH